MSKDYLEKLKKQVKEVKKTIGELAEERMDFSSSSNTSADFDDIIEMEEAIEGQEKTINVLEKLKKQGTNIIFGSDEDNFKGIVDVKSYEENEPIMILNLFT